MIEIKTGHYYKTIDKNRVLYGIVYFLVILWALCFLGSIFIIKRFSHE